MTSIVLKRIVLVKWDSKLGPTPLVQFPPEKLSIDNEVLLKIWANHEMSVNQPVIEITTEASRVVSYYLERHRNRYFLVGLTSLDDTTNYADLFSSIAINLVNSLDTPQFIRILSESFHTIKNYATLNEEQVYFKIFSDLTRRSILTILREGAISRGALETQLQDVYGFTTVNLELLLSPFHQLKLVQRQTIYETDVYFLVQDVACVRVPPKQLLAQKSPLDPAYFSHLRGFFQHYDPLHEEKSDVIHRVIETALQPAVYEVIELLRAGPMKELDFLEMLKTNRKLMRELIDLHIIVKIGNHIYLLSDIKFLNFLPSYIYTSLIRRFMAREIPVDYLIRHAELLEPEKLESPG